MASIWPGWEEELVMTKWEKYAKSQMGELHLLL
jgi:hypothetical protein